MRWIKVFFSLAASVTFFISTQAVSADTYQVPMQVQSADGGTSYAAAYFASTATVTETASGYTVTSTVTTDANSLGDWPVQITSVDGAGVQTSQAQNGATQTLTYTFSTSNLAARHDAAIKVDVNNINYHHTYTVGLVLDTSSIPARQTEASTAAVVSSTSESSSSSSEKASSSKSASHTAADKKTTRADNNDLPVLPIILGGLVIGVGLAAITIVIQRKKQHHD
jgi:hypothetical protein